MKEKVMAQKILVELLDDIDGSEAVGTFRFTDQGVEYEVDFNQEHMDEYEGIFSYLKSIARVVKGKKRAPYGSKKGTTPIIGKTQEMREWLRAAGHDVKDRGRVPSHLVELYNNRPQATEAPAQAPETPVEPPKTEEKVTAPKKTPTARKKAPAKNAAPATAEMAAILAFKEPEAPKKTTRTRAAKTTTTKV
jgi:hypothetical protein